MESFATFAKNVDKDIYQEALNWRSPLGAQTTPLSYFTTVLEKHGVGPSEKELKRQERDLCWRLGYNGVEPTKAAEAKQYEWMETYAAQRWAVDKAMALLNAPTSGPETVTVHKAFSVSAVQAIFPIFYDSRIVEGILANPLLPRLIAETVQITSGTADHVTMNEQTWERSTGRIGEWTRFPEMTISATNAPIKTEKWGGILKASDEAIRRARLPIFARGLARIGMQLADDLTDMALDVLLSGDGNVGTPLVGANDIWVVPVPGSPVYSDLINQMMLFRIGYKPDILVCTKESIGDILNMPQFQDPRAGINFQQTGMMPTPLGLDLLRWDSLASSNYSTSTTLMVQSGIGLIQYSEGGVTSDYQRIVNGQWSEISTSIQTGFAIWDREARKKAEQW